MFIKGLGLSQFFQVSSVARHPVERSPWCWTHRGRRGCRRTRTPPRRGRAGRAAPPSETRTGPGPGYTGAARGKISTFEGEGGLGGLEDLQGVQHGDVALLAHAVREEDAALEE